MTSKKDLISVGIRMIIFFMIVAQISTLPLIFRGDLRDILFKVVFVIVLCGLWIFASLLAEALTSNQDDKTQISLSVESVEYMVVTMIGLWLFLNAIPSIAFAFVAGREGRSVLAGGGSYFTSEGTATMVSGVLQLVLGAIVFSIPVKILATLRKIQGIEWIKHEERGT